MIPILKYINLLLFLFFFSCSSNERKYKLFYPNGDIRVSGTYVDNKAHGFWEGYYPNGQLRSVGEYYNGKLVGHWVWYYEDGSIIRDSTYTNQKFYE